MRKPKKATARPGKSTAQTSISLPPDLLDWARKEAKRDYRNLSTMLAQMLEAKKLEVEKRGSPPPDIGAIVTKAEAKSSRANRPKQ